MDIAVRMEELTAIERLCESFGLSADSARGEARTACWTQGPRVKIFKGVAIA